MSKILKIVLYSVAGLLVVFFVIPKVVEFVPRFTRPSETVIVPATGTADERRVEIVTLLGRDAILAINAPRFVSRELAESFMEPDEQVLGLSINGDHRAYSVRTLSRHEIVNDVVGGAPVAVTW